MKITTTTIIATTVILLAACKKSDYCDKPRHNKKCDLAQSIVSGFGDKEDKASQYRKVYDPGTGKISKVVVGLFTLDLADSISLLVRNDGSTVHLLLESNPTDTVLNAHFGANGRLINITEGNAPNYQLPSTNFSYTSGTLSGVSGPYQLNVTYDAYGNVVKLEDPTLEAQSFYYTYDVSVPAKRQFYPDGFFGDSYNTLFLAEFMGWLPDLEPVSKRISSRTVTGDYELYNAHLTDHVYDGEGKLLSYKSNDAITYTNIWDCNAKK